MKHTFLALLLFISLTTTAYAQIGFEGGVNFANLAIQEAGTKVGTKYLVGAVFGFFGDIRFGNGPIYLEPGAFIQTNGATIKGNPDWKDIIYAGNFPIYLEYKSGEKCGARFFAGIGPYIGDNISINGATNYVGPDIQQMDWGIGLNAGYIGRKHLYFRARYEIGLMNELPAGDSKNYVKQSSGALTIGYMFRGCRSRTSYGGSGHRGGNHWRGLKKNKWSTRQILRRPPGPGL